MPPWYSMPYHFPAILEETRGPQYKGLMMMTNNG